MVCCKFSPDGKYVLSALDVDRGICLMDPENITTVIQIKGEVAGLPTHSSNALPLGQLVNRDLQWVHTVRLPG